MIAVGLLVSEIFMFESVNRQTDAHTDGQTPARVPSFRSGELITTNRYLPDSSLHSFRLHSIRVFHVWPQFKRSMDLQKVVQHSHLILKVFVAYWTLKQQNNQYMNIVKHALHKCTQQRSMQAWQHFCFLDNRATKTALYNHFS